MVRIVRPSWPLAWAQHAIIRLVHLYQHRRRCEVIVCVSFLMAAMSLPCQLNFYILRTFILALSAGSPRDLGFSKNSVLCGQVWKRKSPSHDQDSRKIKMNHG